MKISKKVRYKKILEFGKLTGVTAIGQALVQVIAVVSGLIIIRQLSTTEYAFYTIANTLLGAMAILSDGGIASGVMAQGGRVWNKPKALGTVLSTGLILRKRFSVATLLVTIPLIFYLLVTNGCSLVNCLLIIACLIPAFYATLSDSILEIPVKLNKQVKELQKNQVQVNLLRLFFLLSGIFVFPFAFVGILASGLPRIWGNIRLRKVSSQYAIPGQLPDKQILSELAGISKKIIPGAIYYCLSGQITVWLISLFGNTTDIAHVGALSRLTMLLNFFIVLLQFLVAPGFAKLPAKRIFFIKLFWQVMLAIALVSSFILLFVWHFPRQALFILGNQYEHLTSELFLNVVASCIGLFGSASFVLYSSRGWALHPAIYIPISLFATIAGILVADITTLKGVLQLNIFLVSVQAILHLSLFWKKVLQY